MNNFFSDFFACLYHIYLSLKIEQLFDVFEGIEEHAVTKNKNKINKLFFKIFIFK